MLTRTCNGGGGNSSIVSCVCTNDHEQEETLRFDKQSRRAKILHGINMVMVVSKVWDLEVPKERVGFAEVYLRSSGAWWH